MKILHAGFDGLDVAFRGYIPVKCLNELERAKNAAIKLKEGVRVDLPNGFSAQLAETGAKGGFAFRLDTGADGETWFIKNSTSEDWNLRVSVKSAALLKHGYNGVKQRLYARLEAMGANVFEESIGRVDFAVDFAAPNFDLDPFSFVTHARAKRSVHAGDVREVSAESADMSVIMRGQRVESVTVGKMPGRQVIVYDKSKEVKDRKKQYWWKAWGLEEKTAPRVWRVEVRAGKKYLKDRLGISTWQQLEEHIGDAFVDTLQKVRMRDMRSTEKNVTRAPLHPMWRNALGRISGNFADTLKGQPSVRVIREERKKMCGIFHKLTVGTIVSYGAIRKVKHNEYEKFLNNLMHEIKASLKQDKHKFDEKYRTASDRYMFLRDSSLRIGNAPNQSFT